MKLLLDATNIAPGGGLVVLGNLLSHWREMAVDIDVTAIASRKATADGLLEFRNDIKVLPFMESSSPAKVFWGRKFKLGNVINKLSPDLVFAGNFMVGRCDVPQHVHNQNLLCLMDWPLIPSLKKYGSAWTLRFRLQHRESIASLKNSRTSSFISDYMHAMADKLVPESADKNHTVHNASAVAMNDNYTFNESPQPVIAAIQNSEEYKDNPTLIRVLARCVELRPDVDWKLRLVGGGDWFDVSSLARELDVINRVEFMNHCSVDKLAAILDQAYCLVFTSKCEGFGIPPLDAMGRGCAVVSSNVDALPEVVGDAGILIPPGDVESFASAVIDLYEKPKIRNELVTAGFQRFKKFSWASSAEKLANILLS